jgi:hypothetical protein
MNINSFLGRYATVLLIALAWSVPAFCGEIHDMAKAGNPAKVVPLAEESHHQLMLENEYTRVFHVLIAQKESALMHQHDRDYIDVMIGSAQAEMQKLSTLLSEKGQVDLRVEFRKGPLAHKVTNTGDSASVNLTIEVKKPSKKVVCGVSLSRHALTGGCGGSAGGSSEGESWIRDRKFETDSVSADLVEYSSTHIIDRIRPMLFVALTPITAEWLRTSTLMEAPIVPKAKMLPGDVFWIPMNMNVRVTPELGQSPARHVLVEFQ